MATIPYLGSILVACSDVLAADGSRDVARQQPAVS